MQNNLNLYSPDFINYNNSVKQNPFGYQFKNNNIDYTLGDTGLVNSNSPLKELMLKMENKNKLLNPKNNSLNFSEIKEDLYDENSFDLNLNNGNIIDYLDDDIKAYAKNNNIGIYKNANNTFTFKLTGDVSGWDKIMIHKFGGILSSIRKMQSGSIFTDYNSSRYVPPMVHDWMLNKNDNTFVNTPIINNDPFSSKGIPVIETIESPNFFGSRIATPENKEKFEKETIHGYIPGRDINSKDKEKLEAKKDTILNIYNYLVNNLGTTKEQTAAILGNIYAESGFDPKIEEDTTSVKKGIGILQFTGDRRDSLVNYANEKGKSYKDMNTQLEYLVSEFNDSTLWSNGFNFNSFKNRKTTNPNDYTYILMSSFIRPHKSTSNIKLRMDVTNYLLDNILKNE